MSVPTATTPSPARELAVPALSLVVLVGTTGAGKSTFARRHFAATEVLSSDTCRGLVADDEDDQSATADAFAVLEFIAGRRLAGGRLTVVDATNVQASSRRSLVQLAREHDVLPVAVVLDVPEAVCAQRNLARGNRQFGPHVLRRQRADLRRSLKGLRREGFRTVHVLSGVEEVDAATVVRTRLHNDLRHLSGGFDVVGDVHGCREELESLLTRLGYGLRRDDGGRPVDAVAPEGRRAVFVGDLVDRGPDTPGVLRLVRGMVASGAALCVPGNHEAKLLRALRGRDVQVTHGLAESLAQLAAEPPQFRAEVEEFLDGLVSHYVLDGGRLVVAHAGLPERFHGRASARVRDVCLYGQTTGESDEFGLPVRHAWAQEYRGRATVVYGHTPVPVPEWVNGTLCVDTGCVFGGNLTALRHPEREVVSVPALRVHHAPARTFPANEALGGTRVDGGTAAGPAAVRDPDVLDVDDVLGRRVVETADHGRITVREENAAAALEVVSRFAVDPRWLLHLPPTTAPVATSAHPDFLEHPDEAFTAFRAEGVSGVLCEEKHMGSRALVLVCADEEAARARFGATGGELGAVWTRTGRSFFDAERTQTLLAELRGAVEAAGLFGELSTRWLLLDAELLPWSAKAMPLLREQYASVGAAAGASAPFAVDVLERAAARGADVDDLLQRSRSRAANSAAFTAAYRRYVWPTQGLDGVHLAPFAVLAGDGRTFADQPHAWHLDVADRLVRVAPERLRTTRRLLVDTTDPDSTQAATRWWLEATGAGGEGMVVKPAAGRVRTPRGLVQPALKVRGREYLRLVYGPDYLEPGNLVRLRERTLGRKRSLALREYALGLEGLARAARSEPLWRVHECVVAVLALESEPVDPRL
ncbi:polynucleotide kinase-phosphatase [Kineococcus sp. R8]|uniref:polynucleotide kinase-phosphatase n=1 Tax=Kineococcus siccus TaxID=2696567 RepID=UPI001412459A|nr:polynucleotide kinase-phosphatase [Kineococcus siccus]